MSAETSTDLQHERLLLGALLHDVGKFVIRSCRRGEGKDHCSWGRSGCYL
jgi:CRISPR/Cas system-associated protein Cas10 (large subunit of type III CRISPR-Cas system)